MADTTRKTPGFLFRKSRALSEPLFLRSLCDGSCTQKPATFVCPFPHSEVERKQWQMEIDEDWESYQSQRYEEAKRNGEHYAPAAREHRGSGRDGRDARDDREHRDHREHRDGHDSRHNGTKGSASSTRPTPSRSPSSSSSSGASGGTSPATYRPPRSRTQPSSQQQQQPPHEYDRSSSRSSSSRSEHSSASVVSGSSAVDELLSNHDGSQLEARTTDSRKASGGLLAEWAEIGFNLFSFEEATKWEEYIYFSRKRLEYLARMVEPEWWGEDDFNLRIYLKMVFRRLLEERKVQVMYQAGDAYPTFICFHTGLLLAHNGHDAVYCLIERETRGKRPWIISKFVTVADLIEHNRLYEVNASTYTPPQPADWYPDGIEHSVFNSKFVGQLSSLAIEHIIERSDRMPERYRRFELSVLIHRIKGAYEASVRRALLNPRCVVPSFVIDRFSRRGELLLLLPLSLHEGHGTPFDCAMSLKLSRNRDGVLSYYSAVAVLDLEYAYWGARAIQPVDQEWLRQPVLAAAASIQQPAQQVPAGAHQQHHHQHQQHQHHHHHPSQQAATRHTAAQLDSSGPTKLDWSKARAVSTSSIASASTLQS